MTPCWLSTHADGVVVSLYIQPRASKNMVVGVHDGMLKVSCSSPPVDGKANKDLVAFLARTLGCKKNEVELLRGHTGRRKQFLLHNCTVDAAALLWEE